MAIVSGTLKKLAFVFVKLEQFNKGCLWNDKMVHKWKNIQGKGYLLAIECKWDVDKEDDVNDDSPNMMIKMVFTW